MDTPIDTPLNTPSELDAILKDIRVEIENNPDNYILNYDNLKDLIENAHGHKNKAQLIYEYTPEPPKLQQMLKNLYPLLQDTKMKNRFTRLINKINNSKPKEPTPPITSNNDDHIVEY